jgi:glycosyltransferase involved in cell wall biosynthesis
MHRNLFRRSIAAYIIPDEFMRKVLAQGGFPAQRMFVNSTPFDVNSINASDTFEDYVLFVGRLVPQKGITTLIRAISLVQSPIRVIIVGEGEKRAEIETLASKANGRIEIKGPLYGERMHSLMERALAVIIPSEWYDNAPLALYHAFAHAKPVIASNIHGLKEIVRDGEDGFLFQPGSAAELAKTIDFLVNNRTLAAAMGRRARLKAEMEWDAPMHYLRLRAVLEFCKRH